MSNKEGVLLHNVPYIFIYILLFQTNDCINKGMEGLRKKFCVKKESLQIHKITKRTLQINKMKCNKCKKICEDCGEKITLVCDCFCHEPGTYTVSVEPCCSCRDLRWGVRVGEDLILTNE